MSCDHDCDRPPRFPAAISNRSGLSRFAYRVGDYASMRAHMLDQLVKAPALVGWTHLKADDPGIALLEGAAIVGDVLTFYQELYANETKLGTAAWEESVFDLVRLTGYRPAPGLGGNARFALELRDGDPATVPAGFAFQAKLEGADKPAIFESTMALKAWPALGTFHLYRRRRGRQPITAGATALDIVQLGSATDLATRSDHGIEAGDRVLLGSGRFAPYEVVVVKETEQHLDRVTMHLEGAVQQTHPAELSAYKLGRTFRHYGADAAREFFTFSEDPPRTSRHETEYTRPTNSELAGGAHYSALTAHEMPLDSEVDDLAAGSMVICTFRPLRPTAGTFAIVRCVQQITPREMLWANSTAPVSVLELNAGLPAHDIRRLRVHETRGEEMTLRAPPVQNPAVSNGKVNFFGTRAEAESLAGRTILLDGMTDAPEEIAVATDQPELAAKPSGPLGDRRMWPIALGTVPQSGDAGFTEIDPAVAIHGNVVHATQGDSQAEAAIGSGDARLIFQTFAITTAPLTFLSDSSGTPAYAPELEIRVEGRLWQRVNTFIGQAADAAVYVVRADGAHGHVVQFGDGLSGTRLTSGRNNVTAAWRVGSGAIGKLADDESPKARDRLKSLSKVLMPGPVTGGGAPESMSGARLAAPGRMQSLGRLVGLADYEAEALALPGVVKASAVFAAEAQRPTIALTILTEDESLEAVAAVEDAMRHADRCRGPSRYPLEVIAGRRRYVHLSLLLGYDPAYRTTDLDAAVIAALGALSRADGTPPNTGLFALPQRRFGQDIHISHAIAAVQSIVGVVWVKPDAFGKLPVISDEPDELSAPTNPGLGVRLTVLPSEVLALSELHLTLSASSVISDEECTQ